VQNHGDMKNVCFFIFMHFYKVHNNVYNVNNKFLQISWQEPYGYVNVCFDIFVIILGILMTVFVKLTETYLTKFLIAPNLLAMKSCNSV
jgi:hypothetical protein